VNYTCPRCGKPVKRRLRTTSDLPSALLHFAFGSFQCENCGTIPFSEFPAEIRRKMIRGAVLLIVGAIAVVVVALLSFVYEHLWR
jgi:DNA-directed RNA polymerase subunit RPC12/RpoP